MKNQRLTVPEDVRSSLLDGVFLVAGRRVDSPGNTVEWAGRTHRLEPKAMQLLVCLASRAGQVVSRHELEAEVWAGTVVGYDAITQAISKVRKALCDHSRHPQILETVSKHGYRLIAHPEPCPARPVDTRVVDRAAGPYARGAGISARASDICRKPGFVVAVSLVVLLGLVWLAMRPSLRQEHGSERPVLAVLPFQNLSGAMNLSYLSEVVTQDVATALAGHDEIAVVSSRAVFEERESGGEPTILARRVGARYLVEGSVQGSAESLHINVRLTDTGTNRHLWAKHYDQEMQSVFSVADDISQHVIAVLLPEAVSIAETVLDEQGAESGSEFGYDSMSDRPRRLKCLYGNFAQISGDHATAARIFEDCIERWNDVRSMIALAHILELGVGVPQDLPRAALLLQRGARANDPEGFSSLARYHYGMALLHGSGIAPDGMEGLRWLRRAAAEGVEDAWEYLARHFPDQLPDAPTAADEDQH